jgi:lipopolysaccharide export system permease protein
MNWRIPRLQLFVFRAFIGPFAACFSVTLFILVLQFLARYQDDIFGKGLGGWVIAQLFFYAAVQLVLMSLPIALMMSSLMTFGKLGENYELAAIRSAGISLLAVMRPLIYTGMLLTVIAYYFAWVLIPTANLQLFSLLHDAQQAKPEFALKPGFFNSMIDGYTIYVKNRDPDGTLHGVYIYDHTEHRGNNRILIADRGHIYRDERTLYLHLLLYNGSRYEEDRPNDQHSAGMPFTRTVYDSLHYRLDLSGFGLKRTDQSLFMSHYYMMQHNELAKAIDSVWLLPKQDRLSIRVYMNSQINLRQRLADSLYPNKLPGQTALVKFDSTPAGIERREAAYAALPPQPYDPLTGLDANTKYNIVGRATTNARNLKNYLEISSQQLKDRENEARKYQTEYHMRWAVPFACMVFLFIGAPLGAIVRKGGIGFPVIVSTLFFILFYVVMTNGKKFAREGVMEMIPATWLPIYATAPIAIYVTYQSLTDSSLLEMATYQKLFKRFWFFITRRKTTPPSPTNPS